MSNNRIDKLKKEFEQIRHAAGGLLTPENVVEFAKNKKTALHGEFMWDDTKAAEKYRLYQAGHIIRMVKTDYRPDEKSERIVSTRCYVSLPSDRITEKKGYRHIDTVLSDDVLKLEYIELVQSELSAFQQKLRVISEVAYKRSESVSREVEKERKILSKKIDCQSLGYSKRRMVTIAR